MVSACLPSDALSQYLLSFCGFSFLGHGVSPPGPSSRPWMWSVSSLNLNAVQPIENTDIHLKQSLKRHAYNNSGFQCCKVELPSFPNFFYFISKARWLKYKINITQCFCTWFNCEASCLDLNETSTLGDTNILRKKLKSSHLKLILFLSLPGSEEVTFTTDLSTPSWGITSNQDRTVITKMCEYSSLSVVRCKIGLLA